MSKSLTQNEKLNIIEKEYDIPVEEEFRKDVSIMCNLSQGIVDDTKIEMILNMYNNDIAIEKIAIIADKTIEEVKAIIEKISRFWYRADMIRFIQQSSSGKEQSIPKYRFMPILWDFLL